MLLGKRPRPPMKRTTSMSEITFDLGDQTPSSDLHKHGAAAAAAAALEGLDQRLLSTASPRTNHRRNLSDFPETAHFLRACSLCKRRLVPGRDIYMYRGDSAFCSLECRQQQMNQDERTDKCSVAASNKKPAAAKGETVAAAV